MQYFLSYFCRVIAIDLPGFGKTRGSVSDKGEYLSKVIDTLSPGVKPLVITPSASGAFIFPMLSKYPKKVGYIDFSIYFESSSDYDVCFPRYRDGFLLHPFLPNLVRIFIRI